MRIILVLIILFLNLFILWRWSKRLDKDDKKLAWYWGWILPTDILVLSLYSGFGVLITLLFVFNTFPLNQRSTEREMKLIEKELIKYNQHNGHFPKDLDVLIGNRPLRKDWKSDAWKTNYQLRNNEFSRIILTSAGTDRIFDTEDDLSVVIE